MDVWRLLRRMAVYSGILAVAEGVAVFLWLGKYGLFATVGAWLISGLNILLLIVDGVRLFGMHPVQAQKTARKKAALRLLMIGVLLLALALKLEAEISFVSMGIIFLGVYLSVLVVFVVVVTRAISTENMDLR